MPRPIMGQRVLYNTGNSPFWHMAFVTMPSENDNSLELAAFIVEGRDNMDFGGTSVRVDLKTPCWHVDDPRISANDPLWSAIVDGQTGGKWKFDDSEASYVEDIAELRKYIGVLEKRMAVVDKFMHSLGHHDTFGIKVDEEPKKASRRRTTLADADNDACETGDSAEG